MQPFEVQWQAPEFEYHAKDVSWYWVSIILAAVLIGVAMWQRNFLFGFFIIVAEILILVWGNREPLLIDFTLTDQGLTIGGRTFYPLSDILNFSLEEGSDWSHLNLGLRRRFASGVRVIVPQSRAAEVRKRLKEVSIPEVESERSFLDALQKFLGF